MPTPNVQQKALIIGNNEYRTLRKLRTAVSDANAVAEVFKDAGIDVTAYLNATRQTINRACAAFAEGIRNGGIGIFWFSGHGIQLRGRNILLPIDVTAEDEYSVLDDGVDLDDLIQRWITVAPKALLLIIDACRTSPFPSTRYRAIGAGQGLGDLRAVPPGVFVVYSAGANQVAIDSLGNGDAEPNGLFAREFLQLIRQQPTIEFRTLIHETRGAVYVKARSIGHEQIPAIYDQLVEYIVLAPRHGFGLMPPVSNMREQMVREWGLQGLPTEEQDDAIEKIGSILYQSIVLRATEGLDDAVLARFDQFAENNGENMDAAMALDWLREHVSDLDRIREEEITKLKHRVLNVPAEFGSEASPAITRARNEIYRVFFDHREEVLADQTGFEIMLLAAERYKFSGATQIQVTGYADRDEGTWFKKSLSKRRAGYVADFLAKYGVPRASLVVTDYGATGALGLSEPRNRRVEIVILG